MSFIFVKMDYIKLVLKKYYLGTVIKRFERYAHNTHTDRQTEYWYRKCLSHDPLHTELTPQTSQTHLGLALEVKGEDVFAAPRLALANQEDAVAGRASSQHQLSSFETGQGAVEPLALAERMLHSLGRGHLREQEGPWGTGRGTCDAFRFKRWSMEWLGWLSG